MATKPAGRGSAKLSPAAAGLKAKLKDVKIIDWHELGQPGPELVTGTIQLPADNFRTTLAVLTKLKELRDLNVLIHGTPRPDLVQIKFTART